MGLWSCLSDKYASVYIEHLRGSNISLIFSALENLLIDLAKLIANDLRIDIELDKRPMSFINKYILWFTKKCGLELKLDGERNKKLDAIREIRNRFIHILSREVPEDIKRTLADMTEKISDGDIDDEFVNQSFQEISKLVKKVELSYIDFYDNLKKHD